jgi:hypothetical protein
MKKKPAKKLVFARQTLQHLQPMRAQRIKGGTGGTVYSVDDCSDSCICTEQNTCPKSCDCTNEPGCLTIEMG